VTGGEHLKADSADDGMNGNGNKRLNYCSRKQDLLLSTGVALKEGTSDVIIKNARLVNVVTSRVEEVDVLVCSGLVAWVGPRNSHRLKATPSSTSIPNGEVFDAQGAYLLPGLIDAHTHFEMSMMSAVPFAEAVIPQGTTAAIVDPHDICNVMGIEGMKLLAEEVKCIPLKTFLMVPPCVPSSPKLEDAGAQMTLEDVREGMRIPFAWGIAETMDFARVLEREPEIIRILSWARERGLLVDGHCPDLRGDRLQAYALIGPIRTDHESVTVEEMREKYRLGMKVIIRRGSLNEPASAGDFVNSLDDPSNVLLSTDGCITVGDMLEKGHMNYALRAVVAEGVDPITAVKMATINVARAYGFDHWIGMVAPGRCADLVLVEDLKDFKVKAVFVDGKRVPAPTSFHLMRYAYPSRALNTVRLSAVSPDDFRIEAPAKEGMVRVRVISIVDGTLATGQEIHEMEVKQGLLRADTSRDLLKVAVFERYGRTGTRCIGIVGGFGLRKGAFGGSVGQDTQNVVVVGADDADMALVVNAIREQQGGLVVAAGGRVLANIRLPIAGIMTDENPFALHRQVVALSEALRSLGCLLSNPFLTLSLQLTLAVIPEMKITNRGLVDVASARFIPLFC